MTTIDASQVRRSFADLIALPAQQSVSNLESHGKDAL